MKNKTMRTYRIDYRVGKRTNSLRSTRVRAYTAAKAKRKIKARIRGKLYIRKINRVQ